MEKRKISISETKVCRFCLTRDGSLTCIYDKNLAPKKAAALPLKILACLSIEVFPSDRQPNYICERCQFFMDICYEFKKNCREADNTVLHYVQNGTALKALTIPPLLVKTYHASTKNNTERRIIETEDGATVQLTSHDISDSEDDDEDDDDDVYKIKIRNVAEGKSKNESTSIKFITDSIDLPIIPPRRKQRSKGFTSITKLTRQVQNQIEEKQYKCQYCDKSFTKPNSYARHVNVKHPAELHKSVADSEQYKCEQCEDSFSTQDELIYHSAIHATQNLTCPLCQEKFNNVDAVTLHIKTHVNGTEFMCELCELVFTTQEKLDKHINVAHEEELREEQELGQDESSVDLAYDDDDLINVQEEDDHMVVEIKKPDNFMLSQPVKLEAKANEVNSEDSEMEITYAELSTVDTLAAAKAVLIPNAKAKVNITSIDTYIPKISNKNNDSQQTQSSIKLENMKRKIIESEPAVKEKVKNDNSNDKSLRLLEKELQDLKRTNSRAENVKMLAKNTESSRNKRLLIHTSTPKAGVIKNAEEKKTLIDKKQQDIRRAFTKENKEPKENKETTKNNNNTATKDADVKTVVKNGANDKSSTEEGVRRSTRPSKIKDYAKMTRESPPNNTVEDDDSNDDDDDDDEEYTEVGKVSENRPKVNRGSTKSIPRTATTASASSSTVKKRGRPRKGRNQEVPAKLKKKESNDDSAAENNKSDDNDITEIKDSAPPTEENRETRAPSEQNIISPDLLVSPSGQTLKKVPVKELPPGVKPIPLPINTRPVVAGGLCEMQIGKKVVKVQKIIMTKAEVEAMAKKGLVEMKGGTMVLKQGIKLPTKEELNIKQAVAPKDAGGVKGSPVKKIKATPSRYELDDE